MLRTWLALDQVNLGDHVDFIGSRNCNRWEKCGGREKPGRAFLPHQRNLGRRIKLLAAHPDSNGASLACPPCLARQLVSNRNGMAAMTTACNLGFLTILRESSGHLGGYLVTNQWGRPLEFRLSTTLPP